MYQLMRQQAAAADSLRSILASAKNDVVSHRVSQGIDGLGRALCMAVGVYPHVTEVVPETGLQGSPRGGIERLTRRTQDIVNNSWRDRRSG
jgi:hypothetical protein